MNQFLSLKDLIEQEGYKVEYYVDPQSHPDAVGNPGKCPSASAQLLTNWRIAIKYTDGWDAAYSAAHEICEDRNGFVHSEAMFSDQANLLARWIKKLAHSYEARILFEYGGRGRDQG